MNLGFEWAQKMSQFLFFIFRCKLVKLGKKNGPKSLRCNYNENRNNEN